MSKEEETYGQRKSECPVQENVFIKWVIPSLDVVYTQLPKPRVCAWCPIDIRLGK
jgi:hypothetical protein